MRTILRKSFSIWVKNLFFLAVFVAAFVGLQQQGFAFEHYDVVHFPAAEVNKTSETKGDRNGYPLWGHLGRPAGKGPHPAVVLMHGCGGIQQMHFDWAKTLNADGYVTLVVDSFRPRSLIQQCGGGSTAASPAGRVLDAYGALEFLRGQNDVDPDRIGLMGWSHGGISALSAVTDNGVGATFPAEFQTVIALYPHCVASRRFTKPVAVIIGASDDWTSAASCENLQKQTQSHSHVLDLTVYPDAFHGFDNPMFGSGFFVPGAPGQKHWLQYNRAAHQKAVQRTKQLLGERL
ncbi:dienelactone hydrolase family protein [Labrenzia sp. PHM005]|uniref:dienelactone hydrolase family protein n=1 Tax=Labrenzia sp. PHM005 TaxID=2590016 RepID=UPI00143D5EDD|nr:dienelactone hydrolase family protein [Labrenzia sp. PHM005]